MTNSRNNYITQFFIENKHFQESLVSLRDKIASDLPDVPNDVPKLGLRVLGFRFVFRDDSHKSKVYWKISEFFWNLTWKISTRLSVSRWTWIAISPFSLSEKKFKRNYSKVLIITSTSSIKQVKWIEIN